MFYDSFFFVRIYDKIILPERKKIKINSIGKEEGIFCLQDTKNP